MQNPAFGFYDRSSDLSELSFHIYPDWIAPDTMRISCGQIRLAVTRYASVVSAFRSAQA